MTPSPLIPLKRVFQEYKGYHAGVLDAPSLRYEWQVFYTIHSVRNPDSSYTGLVEFQFNCRTTKKEITAPLTSPYGYAVVLNTSPVRYETDPLEVFWYFFKDSFAEDSQSNIVSDRKDPAVGVLPALLAVLEEAESYLTSPMELLSESLLSSDKKPSAIV